jgi:hypothetical protein
MEYLGEIIWYLSLPITIFLTVKFVQNNLQHFNKLERLEAYEKRYGDIDVVEEEKKK